MGARRAIKTVFCGALALPAIVSVAAAQEQPVFLPMAAWFGGVGGGFNAVSLTQDLDGFSNPRAFSRAARWS